MASKQRIELPSFDLNAKPLDSLDIEERPPPIVKLVDTQHHAQLSTTIVMDNPLEFNLAYILKMHAISEKLNEIYVANVRWQHQHTIVSFSSPHRFHEVNLRIWKDTWMNIYPAKYLMCVFMSSLIIITKRSIFSCYWICDTPIIQQLSSFFPNVSYYIGVIVRWWSILWHNFN